MKDYISEYKDDLIYFSDIVVICLKLLLLCFINYLRTETQKNSAEK